MASGSVDESRIGLQDFVNAVKAEISKIVRDDTERMFRLNTVDLELSFVASTSGGGGLNFWVVSLEGKHEKEKTHTVRLGLTPIHDIQFAE